MATVGFIGLGNMGSVLAGNLVAAGHTVVAHDVAGPGRLPSGPGTAGSAVFAGSAAEVARASDIIAISLPDGSVSGQVAKEIAAADGRRATHLVDTSTIGVRAAQQIGALLAADGLTYVDAPVSGGVAGARARTLAVMYAAPDEACAYVEPVLAGLSDKLFRVGDRPGLGQAMKLANNFLSATALAATSEAVAFGLTAGLDMGTMVDVLNAASGMNTATRDKFPQQIQTGRYAAGFTNTLMAKDVRLYRAEAAEAADVHGTAGRSPVAIGDVIGAVWDRFEAAEPGADFTRVFPFLRGL
jgi:3-hydroxyisobutyrate dehydrogenase-like beta-hydroxyacid dehydrogenase